MGSAGLRDTCGRKPAGGIRRLRGWRWPATWGVLILSMPALIAWGSFGEGALASAATIPQIPPRQSVPVTAAWGVVSIVFAPIWIAYDKGYFTKYGLNVTLEHAGGGVVMVQAVASGKIQFGHVGGVELLNVRAAGSPMVALMQATNAIVFEIHAPPSIRTIKDLRGKTVAITRIGTLTDMVARVILVNHGLDPDRDVKYIQMNGMEGVLTALQQKLADAGVFSYPVAARAAAVGFPKLASAVDEHVRLSQSLLSVMKPYADAHPAVVFAYMKGYLEGLRDFLKNRDLALAVSAKYTRSDPEDVRLAYEATRPAMEAHHYVDVEGLRTVQRYGGNPNISTAAIRFAHDDSYLHALEESGFFNQLGIQP